MTIKSQSRFYHVAIENATGKATHFVEVYTFDDNRNYIAMDFCRYSRTTDDDNIILPKNRLPTFKEKLRVLNKASTVAIGQRNEETKLIKLKMREAYGNNVKVNIRMPYVNNIVH